MRRLEQAGVSTGILYMVSSTICFSLMNLIIKYLPHIPPYELVFFRSVFILSVAFVFLKSKGIKLWGVNRKFLILRGLAGALALTAFFYTIQHMPLASAVTIQYMSPIFATLITAIVLKERIFKAQWLFFILSFIGVILIKGFDPRINLFELSLGLCSAFFAGIAYTCIRVLKPTDHPFVIVFYFPLVTLPIVSPFTYANWVSPEGYEWLLLLAVGIVTLSGQYFITKALSSDENMGVVTNIKYIGVLLAFIYGFSFFGETFNWLSLAGIILILAGIIGNVIYKQYVSMKNQ